MAEKLKAAILGYGGMGHFHAAQYAAQKNVKLVALCDIDPKKFEQGKAEINLGASDVVDISKLNKYLCYKDLIANEELDYIDICLPTDLHAEYTIRAMKDGLNVLCEKPMALNVRDCDRMIRVSKETGKMFMIAQCLRFDYGYEYVRSAYETGKYGKLKRLVLHRVGGLPGGWFRDVRRSGGALMDLHIHDVDYVLSMLGVPESMVCFGSSLFSGGIDDLTANLIYPDGLTVSGESSWGRSGWHCMLSAMFEKATIDLCPEVKIYQPDKPVKTVTFPKSKQTNMYFNEIAYFASCVKTGKRPERCLPESTRETIRIIREEIRSASAGGRRINCGK